MTLPSERYNAILRTEKFLIELQDPSKTPRVPRYIRERVYSCLRHYPSEYHLEHFEESINKEDKI
jgi:hypothetical protein